MNLLKRTTNASSHMFDFDLLRATLENNIARPSVIAITSATAEDSTGIAAGNLVTSLAAAGYRTVYIDTARANSRSSTGLDLEQCAKEAVLESVPGRVVSIALSDPIVQKSTSQRNVRSAIETLYGSFDYVVINMSADASSSLAASVLAAATAVLVAIKKGRRQKAVDIDLATALNRLDVQFLGVLSLSPRLTRAEPAPLSTSSTTTDSRRSQPLSVEKALIAGK